MKPLDPASLLKKLHKSIGVKYYWNNIQQSQPKLKNTCTSTCFFLIKYSRRLDGVVQILTVALSADIEGFIRS